MHFIRTFQKRNLLLVLFVVILAAVGLMVRVFYLMIPGSAHLAEAAKNLHERERVIKAERGKIYDRNGEILADNMPVCTISVIHNQITDNKEQIKIKYESDCKDKKEFLDLLKKQENIDIMKGYTSKGAHRDDFYIYINENQVNVYGSQGQHRTVILSLKLSELEIICDEVGEYPILLLDDFMSELDQKRRNNFLNHIEKTQVFITCTDELEIKQLEGNLYKVNNGKIK